jgi:hypothetical protein
MSGLGRAGAVLRRRAARLLPADRRDWAEAVWAEAREVPPGPRRLAWRAGGTWMVARETLMRRRVGSAVLFAVAAAAAAWVAWPTSPASSATPGDRVYVITMVLLAGLPLLARPFLGPAGGSRAARFLRAGTCAAVLALIPAQTAVEQFAYTPPGGGTDLRVYQLIQSQPGNDPWTLQLISLIIMALYVPAIIWMTSRRARIAPATLAAGTGAGIALGLVMYAVAPLGLSKDATNPWLPGSDIDPLVLLAWLLVFCSPVAAAIIADRRYTALSSSPAPTGAVRQVVAAALLTSLTGALSVTVLGFGTTATMLKAAWLRNWLYHGPHLLYGVQNLSSALSTPSAIAYSHELTGSSDTTTFLLICIAFPLIALPLTGWAALSAWAGGVAAPGGPGRGSGPGPEPAPEPPDGGQPAVTVDNVSLAADLAALPGPREPGPATEQDQIVANLADAGLGPLRGLWRPDPLGRESVAP